MKKKKKTGWIILVCFVFIIIIMAGAISFMMKGLEQNKNLDISIVSAQNLADMTYEGSYGSGRWYNEVLVTVENGLIVDIEPKKTVMFERQEITNELISRIIKEQSTNVDTISSATVTCNVYLKSIENALTNAERGN